MWQWMIDQGLIEGEAAYYEDTTTTPGSAYSHAVEVAYKAANDEQRKQLVDLLWETGYFEGDKTHWYTDRSESAEEMANLKHAALSMGVYEPGEGSDLLLPEGFELWLNEDTGTYFVVVKSPGVELDDGTKTDGIFVSWEVESDADLEALLGPDKEPDPHFVGGNDDFTSKGVIDLGGVDELNVMDLEGNPFDKWVEDMTILAQVQPWILEDDYQALVIQAALERADGQISLEEIQSTQWWKDHNEGERAWMETWHSDQTTAEQMLADNRENLRSRLVAVGINNATPELINWMADRTTMGHWSVSHLEGQMRALADPYSVDVIDDDLYEFMATQGFTPDYTHEAEDLVRKHLRTWLGPMYGSMSEDEIARQAGLIRNDPDAEQAFIEGLKDQRLALYQNHTDRELSYEAIAAPWRSYSQSIWGQPVDDTDEIFQEVVKMNDGREAGTLLRKVGLERGYSKVLGDVMGGLRAGMQTNVRGAV